MSKLAAGEILKCYQDDGNKLYFVELIISLDSRPTSIDIVQRISTIHQWVRLQGWSWKCSDGKLCIRRILLISKAGFHFWWMAFAAFPIADIDTVSPPSASPLFRLDERKAPQKMMHVYEKNNAVLVADLGVRRTSRTPFLDIRTDRISPFNVYWPLRFIQVFILAPIHFISGSHRSLLVLDAHRTNHAYGFEVQSALYR